MDLWVSQLSPIRPDCLRQLEQLDSVPCVSPLEDTKLAHTSGSGAAGVVPYPRLVQSSQMLLFALYKSRGLGRMMDLGYWMG